MSFYLCIHLFRYGHRCGCVRECGYRGDMGDRRGGRKKPERGRQGRRDKGRRGGERQGTRAKNVIFMYIYMCGYVYIVRVYIYVIV